MSGVSSEEFTQGGVSLWRWSAKQQDWSLVKDETKPGFRRGKAPPQEYAGRFDGDIRIVPSAPDASS